MSGVLGEKFEILDFEKFKNSDIIKKYPIFMEKVDLSDKISMPEKARVKSKEVGD